MVFEGQLPPETPAAGDAPQIEGAAKSSEIASTYLGDSSEDSEQQS
tara:strand:+ start:1706 stop:1843 length:138 start_codon:yes stop_codon:yes gene_type:complete